VYDQDGAAIPGESVDLGAYTPAVPVRSILAHRHTECRGNVVIDVHDHMMTNVATSTTITVEDIEYRRS